MGDVELPRDLVDAHRSGDLVIFVGAGASIAPPSNLPSFWKLTEEIAADAGVPMGTDELDVILGYADAHPLMDVHRRIAETIGVATSRPNDVHRAIGRLAAAGPTARVVTTNYDRHLSTVLPGLAEYRGPALPLGNDFDGLVYLHGTLGQDPRRLVATDADFGAAYLLDGWAVRFLERMFRSFTVLFVGYSHNDFAMTYLARALPASSRRFAFTVDDPDQARHWQRLGITAVPYTKDAQDHTPLPIVLGKWAGQAAMSLLDHRQRVAELLSGPPSGVPEEMSYLEDIVATADKVTYFAEYARGPEWLAWATERPEFRRLFTAEPGDSSLAEWFAQHYVAVEELTEAAFQAVRSCGGRLGPQVWHSIGRLMTDPGPAARPPWLSKWLVLLVRDDPGAGPGWLEEALRASLLPADRDAALLLFAHLTTPAVEFPRFTLTRLGTFFELTVRGEPSSLRDAWQEALVPHLASVAAEVLVIADTHLRQAYRLLATARSGRWDLVSRARSAIEPHEQDNVHEPLDILIDAARDCLEELLRSDPGTAREQLRSWESAEPELLRRLAVHGWVCREDVTATAKLTWLRERGWLLVGQLWHEVAMLIAKTAATADEPVLDALVADVVKAPDDVATEHEKAGIIHWIARHAPQLASARAAMTAWPGFQASKHPDLRRWTEGGTVPPRPPMSVEALHERITEDPAAAVVELRRFEDVDWSIDETTWEDALGLLQRTVAEHPEDGFAAIGTGATVIFPAVVKGWAAAEPDQATAAEVVRSLRDDVLPFAAMEIAELLSGADWAAGAHELADRTWEAVQGESSRVASDDWYSVAINHPGGWLAEFWVRVVEAARQADPDGWTGLPDSMKERLERMIADSLAAPIIFSYFLPFLHAVDHEWAESRILPLLDWSSDEERARRCWDGYLSSGRVNDRLLEAGLRTSLLEAARRVDQFRPERGRGITGVLAQVTFYATADPGEWLPKFTRTAPTEARTAWIRDVDELLAGAGTEVAEAQWSRWMRSYWRNRLDSRPLSLTDGEASAMAAWALRLKDSTDEAVTLATRHGARFDPHTRLLKSFDDRVEEHPEAYGRLLLHLLRATEKPFYGGRRLGAIVEKLRPSIDVEPLRNEVARLS
ncbi:SIR2 family protein [Symbioplanes lichenis]|uniref:SIR2 family protein n=1 Tax=Symbioplanes lichenis TaxID=1629072 RepID=UPI0027382736|nr:SIR2 family protein [Actinoplanes lichenis]